MSNVREIDPSTPPRGVHLHLASSGTHTLRCFAVRPDRRGAVLDYDGLPKIGEAHPDDAGLECHALIPRPVQRGEVEVWALYRPAMGPVKRVAA